MCPNLQKFLGVGYPKTSDSFLKEIDGTFATYFDIMSGQPMKCFVP